MDPLFAKTKRMLVMAHEWSSAPTLGKIPKRLSNAIHRADALAWSDVKQNGNMGFNAGHEPVLHLAIALGQVLEDLIGYEQNWPHRRQPDGSPISRFWFAMSTVAERLQEIAGNDSTITKIRHDFLLRSQNATYDGELREAPLVTPIRKEAVTLALKFWEESGRTIGGTALARKLQEAGFPVQISSITAVIYRRRKELEKKRNG